MSIFKRYLIWLFIIAVCLLSAEIVTGGKLPTDRNGNAIQLGTTIRLYDNDNTNIEHIDENTFITHVNWDTVEEFDDTEKNARWIWADTLGVVSSLTQVNADMLIATRNGQNLLLTYDVAIPTPLVGGEIITWISGICDSLTLDVEVGTGKTLAITTKNTASVSDFVITIDPDTLVSAGVIIFDNLYLTAYAESPMTLTTGASETLTIPDNAVSIYIDPATVDIKVTIGTAYFITSTPVTIPVSELGTITISDVAGGSVVSFYFNMI